MEKRLFTLTIIGAVMCLALQAEAVEFQPLGFEASSMGGAGVASAKGSFAPYYNPALLAEERHAVEISLSGGVGMREIDVVDHIDKLADIDIDQTFSELENAYNPSDPLNSTIPSSVQSDFTTIKSELNALSQRNGVQLMPSASLGMQIGNFGFGAYGVSEASAHAVIDPNRLDIIVQIDVLGTDWYATYDEVSNTITDFTLDPTAYQNSSLEYAINNKLTYVKLTGLAYAEIPIAYGHQFSTDFGKFDVGASFKVMPGYTYDYSIAVDTKSNNLSDELDNAKKKDTSFGIDVGLLYKPEAISNLSLGLVGKNLNTPKFDTASGGELEVEPQIRAGIAYDLLGDRVTLALDADLTENETFIPNYNSRFVGGGINLHPFSWLSLRGGLMENISESDEGIIYTGGFSLGTKWIQLDVAGQLSSKKGEFEGEEIPRYARVQVSLVSKWF